MNVGKFLLGTAGFILGFVIYDRFESGLEMLDDAREMRRKTKDKLRKE